MVVTDTLEGLIDGRLFFHYDMGNDVLYLRRADHRERECFGEETQRGIMFKDAETDEVVGWTALDWWKECGEGPLPDSLTVLSDRIDSWAKGMPA